MNVSLTTEISKLPTRKHPTDAGIDLYFPFHNEAVIVPPHEIRIINTGIRVNIPHGNFGWVTMCSKNNFLILGGIIDYGYTGNILVKVLNPLNEELVINPGEKIAQMLVLPCIVEPVVQVDDKDLFPQETQRGATGGVVTQYTKGEFVK